MQDLKNDGIRRAVREKYGKVAEARDAGCGCASSSSSTCCSSPSAADAAIAVGYSKSDVTIVPDGANMGLGCGNPQAIASLKAGETVLDLGSGGGFDCFLAAQAVGESGQVIGVDMTPEMISKARGNADKAGHGNIEFRLGEIEALPVADNTVDVIMSNCVINLSPDKERVFREAFRVLRKGGRLAISDVVATAEPPAEIRNDLALYTGCIAGASPIEELEAILKKTGFTGIRIRPKDESREIVRTWAPGRKIEDYVVSATIEAVKQTA